MINVFCSSDADDAFMMYGLAHDLVDCEGLSFKLEQNDIQKLNTLALTSDVDVTALSVHACVYVYKKYKLLSCAASFAGIDYGPKVISLTRDSSILGDRRTKVALPGNMTSANLAFRIFLAESGSELELVNMDFDKIPQAVSEGEVDAGVVIHEGQLTHDQFGLNCILDLGKWWWDKYQSLMPLGVMVVSNKFAIDKQKKIKQYISESIKTALENRAQALEYAQQFSKGLNLTVLDRYVNMYVNEISVDMGEAGREAINVFLNEGRKFDIIKEDFELSFV